MSEGILNSFLQLGEESRGQIVILRLLVDDEQPDRAFGGKEVDDANAALAFLGPRNEFPASGLAAMKLMNSSRSASRQTSAA
jgi:hypothetical protein